MGRLLPSHVTLKYKCLSPVSIPKSFVHDTLHSQRLFTFLIFKQTRWNLLLDNHSLLLSLLKLIPASLAEHNEKAVFLFLCQSLWMTGRHSLLMCIKWSLVPLSPCQLYISSTWINYTWLVQAESSLEPSTLICTKDTVPSGHRNRGFDGTFWNHDLCLPWEMVFFPFGASVAGLNPPD